MTSNRSTLQKDKQVLLINCQHQFCHILRLNIDRDKKREKERERESLEGFMVIRFIKSKSPLIYCHHLITPTFFFFQRTRTQKFDKMPKE